MCHHQLTQHEESWASPVQDTPPALPGTPSGAGRTKHSSWIHPPCASSGGRLCPSNVPSNTESTK